MVTSRETFFYNPLVGEHRDFKLLNGIKEHILVKWSEFGRAHVFNYDLASNSLFFFVKCVLLACLLTT